MHSTKKIKAFERILVLELILSSLLLIISREFPQLLIPFSYLSFSFILFVQFFYFFSPSLSLLHLIFILFSGVISFFSSKIGFNLNFILYPIVLFSFSIKISFSRIQFIVFSLLAIYYFILLVNSLNTPFSRYVSSGDGSTIFTLIFCLLIYSLILFRGLSLDLNLLFLKVIFISFLILCFDFLSTIIYGPLESEVIGFEEKRLSIKFSGVAIQGNQLGVWLAIFFPLLSSQLLIRLKKIYSFIICILFLFVIILIGSRGGLVLFLIALFFIFRKKINYFFVSVLVISLLLLISILLPIIENSNMAIYWKLVNTGDEGYGDDVRLSKYIEVSKIIFEYPILGIGLNNYSAYSSSIGFDGFNTHNTILSVLVEQGVLGFLFFFFLFIMPIYFIKYNRNYYKSDELYSIYISYFLVFLAFFLDHFQGLIYYYIWIGYITTFVLNRRKILK
jgi:O-antigen ligase